MVIRAGHPRELGTTSRTKILGCSIRPRQERGFPLPFCESNSRARTVGISIQIAFRTQLT